MLPKITIEEFNKIKEELQRTLENISQRLESEATDNLSPEEYDELENKAILEYASVQNKLWNYDLSDIPFEAWQGMYIMSNQDLDLSQNHANLDFNILEDFTVMGTVNLKGCKLRNLDRIHATLKEDYLDPEVMSEYPALFLSSIFPKEFREKFLSKSIALEDLKDLNSAQIEELREKNIYNFIKNYNQGSSRDIQLKELLRVIPIDKFVYLLNKDEELLKDAAVIAELSVRYLYLDENNEVVKLLINESDIELIRTKLQEIFNELIATYDYYNRFSIDNFSTTFKQNNQSIFPNINDLPEELQQKIRDNKLTIEDLITYGNYLSGINVIPYMDRSMPYNQRKLLELLGKHLSFLAYSFPMLFQKMEELLDDYTVRDSLEENFKQGIPFAEADGHEAIQNLFIQSLFGKLFGRDNNFVFSKSESPDIYEDCFYPDWMKETGYYVSHVVSANDIYNSAVGYITSKTIIEDESLKIVFDTLGYENIKRLERKNYFFTTKVVKYIAQVLETLKVEPATDYEDFKSKLLYITFNSKGYEKRELLDSLNRIKEDFFDNKEEFMISEDAPAKLKEWYYNGDLDLRRVLRNREWIPYLSKLDLNKIGAYIPINVFNSEHENKYITEVNFVNLFLSENTQEELLEFIFNYSDYFVTNYRYTIDVRNVSKEVLEQNFIKAIVKEVKSYNKVKLSPDSPDTFKNLYPSLFLPADAPDDLKSAFYGRYLSLDYINQHPEWIPYLSNVDPVLINNLTIGVNFDVDPSLPFANGEDSVEITELYIREYGLKAYLEFISKYPVLPFNITNRVSFLLSLNDARKDTLEEAIQRIYSDVIKGKSLINFENMPQEFKDKYPDLFLPETAPAELKEAYYSRKLTFSIIRNNPNYIEFIKDMDLTTAFDDRFTLWLDDIYASVKKTIPVVLQYMSKEQFLELISTYGEYFAYLRLKPEFFEVESFEQLKANLEEKIITTLKDHTNFTNYLKYQEDAPAFIKEQLPDYFLDKDAPQDLKNHFYQISPNYPLTFEIIGTHKEWHPFLKNKNLIPALAKLNDISLRDNSIKFVELFGQDNALRLSASRTETVSKMINARKVELMYEWWLKTGKKFIPDYTIMQLFNIEEADKFLSHGKEWSSLMKNKRFSTTQEGKESMIKLGYSFGVFDGDQQGFKKLDSLLNDIPKKLNQSDMDKLLQAEKIINNPNSQEIKPGLEEYQLLRSVLSQEGIEITGESIFEELYRKNEDDTYTLTINTQEYPKSRELLRTFMEKNNLSMVISAAKAHTLFGAFDLIYDRDFREFLLKNLEVFITTPEYVKYISSIQKQFQLIKTMNSNRVLTPELAVSFVQENKFENIEVGNEELSRVSSVAGYTQAEFDTLQQIYNYGKSRVTSSIPRIEGTKGIYSYEILRLTDPLAIAIGTLTDCCQELGNAAEVCMEHSMVDKHGRVFVIRDEEGNIVAQSWVWRNKDVLCFDNIEIPDKAFVRAERGTIPKTKQEFAKEVYDVYKQAAQDLIAKDEEVYKTLLEQGLITQEQYDGLRLGKITVGLGYNDIAEALNKYAPMDSETPSRPLSFTPPVELSRGLYTSDSTSQRVLEQREDRNPSIEGLQTLPVHHDEFEIYDATNINRHVVYAMNRLEGAIGRYSYQMNTRVESYENSKSIMEEISENYGINANNTKIMINPNFCIIYEETENEIKIVDVLSTLQIVNQRVDHSAQEKVTLQMKIAILQLLKAGKPFNTNSLSQRELETLNSIMELPEQALEQERGISHGTI